MRAPFVARPSESVAAALCRLHRRPARARQPLRARPAAHRRRAQRTPAPAARRTGRRWPWRALAPRRRQPDKAPTAVGFVVLPLDQPTLLDVRDHVADDRLPPAEVPTQLPA